MILPVYALGQPVLKKVAKEITPEYPELEKLLEDMWETMYHSNGVGIAAPQIGLSIRMFVIDTDQILEENDERGKGLKQVFINPELVEFAGDDWAYEEGCLSIPHVRGDVERPEEITLKYLDENFKEHTTTFSSINARVIQHEYDHLEGVLFTEKLKPIKRRRIQRKLDDIKKGNISIDYKLKFYKARRSQS